MADRDPLATGHASLSALHIAAPQKKQQQKERHATNRNLISPKPCHSEKGRQLLFDNMATATNSYRGYFRREQLKQLELPMNNTPADECHRIG